MVRPPVVLHGAWRASEPQSTLGRSGVLPSRHQRLWTRLHATVYDSAWEREVMSLDPTTVRSGSLSSPQGGLSPYGGSESRRVLE